VHTQRPLPKHLEQLYKCPKQPEAKMTPTGEYVNIYVVECYTTIKKDQLLIQVDSWMNFKDIMLSERSQS
jgi:hypothetical protein